MMSIKKKRRLRAVLALMCVVTIASVETSVYAEPSSKELEEKTSDLKGELNSLHSELSALSAKLDDTSAKIENMAADVEKAKLDLAAAKINETAQYNAMKERIQFMYEGGSVSLLQILLTSEDMTDFLNKAEYISIISDYDRAMLEEIQSVRKDVEAKQKKLENQQKELSALQKDLTAQSQALNTKISSTSGELADYSAQLARAKAAEEAIKTAQDNAQSGNISSGSDSGKKPGNGNKPNGGNKPNNGNKPDGGGGIIDGGDSKPSDTSETALLAAILQCEAGSSYDGMIAVGTVIMNRVSSSRFPNTIKGVIYQKGQFSPVSSGKLERVLKKGPSSSAYSAAKAVLGGKRHSKVIKCLFFNASWTGKDGIPVGGNVFW